MPHLFPEDFNSVYEDESSSNYFSMLHLNIRSIKKNFKMFLNSINFTYSIICFSETGHRSDLSINNKDIESNSVEISSNKK